MIFVFHVNFWGSRYSCGAHVNMSFYTMNDLCRTLYVCTGPISMMRREGPCVVGPERCHQNNRIQRKKKTCNIILKTTSPIEFVSNRVTSDSNKKHHFPIRETSKVSLPVATRLSSGRRLTPTAKPVGMKAWIPADENGSTVPQGAVLTGNGCQVCQVHIYIYYMIYSICICIYIYIYIWVSSYTAYISKFVCVYVYTQYIYICMSYCILPTTFTLDSWW